MEYEYPFQRFAERLIQSEDPGHARVVKKKQDDHITRLIKSTAALERRLRKGKKNV